MLIPSILELSFYQHESLKNLHFIGILFPFKIVTTVRAIIETGDIRLCRFCIESSELSDKRKMRYGHRKRRVFIVLQP